MQDFIETLGPKIHKELLLNWPFDYDFVEIRSTFEHCRLRVLYVGEESLEWVLHTPYNNEDGDDLSVVAGLC